MTKDRGKNYKELTLNYKKFVTIQLLASGSRIKPLSHKGIEAFCVNFNFITPKLINASPIMQFVTPTSLFHYEDS